MLGSRVTARMMSASGISILSGEVDVKLSVPTWGPRYIEAGEVVTCTPRAIFDILKRLHR